MVAHDRGPDSKEGEWRVEAAGCRAVVVRLQSVPLAETSSHLQGAGGLILGCTQISKPEMADPLMTRISLPL